MCRKSSDGLSRPGSLQYTKGIKLLVRERGRKITRGSSAQINRLRDGSLYLAGAPSGAHAPKIKSETGRAHHQQVPAVGNVIVTAEFLAPCPGQESEGRQIGHQPPGAVQVLLNIAPAALGLVVEPDRQGRDDDQYDSPGEGPTRPVKEEGAEGEGHWRQECEHG